MATQRISWATPAAVDAADSGGLDALTRFARFAVGADAAVAFEAEAGGLAIPLAADPGPVPQPFSLAATRLDGAGWEQGPQPADLMRLPSGLLMALGTPVREALFLSTPSPSAPRSGLLLMWGSNTERRCDCPFRSGIETAVPMLSAAFGHVMNARHAFLERRAMAERFHDLFESVSSGVVVLDGEGTTGIVNQHAATLLGVSPGEIDTGSLAQAMRALREGAGNAEDLLERYRAHQARVDYALTAVWWIGERRIKVDTHPVLGDGRKGRIWLFEDVTAEWLHAEELRLMAETDPLTGLANRRRFQAAAGDALARSRAESRPLALLMIDIDHFKSVNDRHGHAAGDQVLRAVAGRCLSAVRGGDILARLGGEEFAVLLPDVGHADAATAAERLRAAVAASPVEVDGTSIEVRISIGGTQRRPEEEALQPLIERADRGLYEAKRSGRDRVVFEHG